MATLLYFIKMQQVKEVFFVLFALWGLKLKMDLVYSYINNKLTLRTLITIIKEIVILICWLRYCDFRFTTLYYFPTQSFSFSLQHLLLVSHLSAVKHTVIVHHAFVNYFRWIGHVTQNMHNRIVNNYFIRGDHSLSPSPPLLSSSHTRLWVSEWVYAWRASLDQPERVSQETQSCVCKEGGRGMVRWMEGGKGRVIEG